MNFTPNRTALIIGGRGFLGGFVIASLRTRGWQIKVLVRPAGRELTNEELPGDLREMLDPGEWNDVLDGVDVVVNAAGILREEAGQTFDVVHYRAPIACAQACAQRGIKFVQISALGHADDGAFIESKHRLDDALLSMDIDAVVLRPSIVYTAQGSYGGTSLLRALAAFPGRHLLPGHGRWLLQPISAEDLGEVVASAAGRGGGGMYELGSEQPLSLRDYQATWRRWLNIPGSKALEVPQSLVSAQTWVFEMLGRGPVGLTMWRMLRRGNITQPNAWQKVAQAFGVRIRSLEEALTAKPSQTQDRWAAQLYFLGPWLKWSMVAVWLLSGWVGLTTPAQDIEALAYDSVLDNGWAVEMARAAAVVNIVLGMSLAWGVKARTVILLMMASVLTYTVVFGLAVPATLNDPLGGLIKNLALLPALAVLWVLVERR